jgi:hypothetical protein
MEISTHLRRKIKARAENMHENGLLRKMNWKYNFLKGKQQRKHGANFIGNGNNTRILEK